MASTESTESESFAYFLYVHRPQLQQSSIPEIYWNSLHRKLKEKIYDAGVYFSADMEDRGSNLTVSQPDGISLTDPNCICLVDHEFTFEIHNAMEKLNSTHELAENLCSMLGSISDIPIEEIAQKGLLRSEIIRRVYRDMWLHAHRYNVRKLEIKDGTAKTVDTNVYEDVTQWFIPDALGCHLRHSDDPTVEFRCFYYTPENRFLSLIYPRKNLKQGDVAICNFVPDASMSQLRRNASLYPWLPSNLDLDSVEDDWMSTARDYKKKESVPATNARAALTFFQGKGVKVFTDYNVVKKYLTDENFTITNDMSDANVLWISSHIKDLEFLADTPALVVSQFPNEQILTCKHLLSDVVKRTALLSHKHNVADDVVANRGPLWYKPTFNLKTELHQFIKYYKSNATRSKNVWICKRWNLGRGIGHVVSDNLNEIIRMAEGEPRIASQYIEDPVLFHRDDVGRVKFDIRYMVSLVSVQPLVLYGCETFYTRFANREFSLDDFHVYEKHFTVMNYREDAKLLQIHDKDFVKMFEKQYPSHTWKDLEDQMFDSIWKVFQCISEAAEPHGIGHNPQCRAVYGFDFMVEWVDADHTRMQSIMLECNFQPSMERPCLYQPYLVNDLFRLLFLGQTDDCHHFLLPRGGTK